MYDVSHFVIAANGGSLAQVGNRYSVRLLLPLIMNI
jgi:hypothetical protein